MISRILFIFSVLFSTPALAAGATGNLLHVGNVFRIVCTTNNTEINIGTGFLFTKTLVVTAAHVISTAKDNNACRDYDDNIPVKIKAIWFDSDLAVLQGDFGNREPIPFSCEPFKEDETYYAIGFALGKNFVMSKLVGYGSYNMVGATSEYPYVLEHMAVLNGFAQQGMSGGPIINSEGKVVGINNASGINNSGPPDVLSRQLLDLPFCDKK